MKFYLRKVRLTPTGYDEFGQYWGVGPHLYFYEAEDCSTLGHIRAPGRETAKDCVLALYPDATFFR
jgi:hypothetical protein